MKLRKFIVSVSMAGIPIFGFAWSQKGHDTVAFIAESHLTPEAKVAAEELLDGKSIVYYANWLDNASHTPEYAYTKTWHYKNVDDGQTYENAPINEDGDIVLALKDQIKILGDTARSKEERALALKMVVHFMGDVHQPMHLGHATDLGGNKWNVNFFRKSTNLHSVWDSDLVEAAHNWSHTEWQREIDRLSEDEISEVTKSDNPEDWAVETLQIADKVYRTTPIDSRIEYDYIAKWTPVVEQQFIRGGLRLARILNETLNK